MSLMRPERHTLGSSITKAGKRTGSPESNAVERDIEGLGGGREGWGGGCYGLCE